MRLDQLRIGSAKDSPTHRFKNLKDVSIDFDERHWVTVLIGWNGTGKSNVLEALAIIFRDLITGMRRPAFAYRLVYRMGVGDNLRHIVIDADPDRARQPLAAWIATPEEFNARDKALDLLVPELDSFPGSRVSLKQFLAPNNADLPRYVFSYYSGESTRMREIFQPYLDRYDSRLRKGEDPGLKRLFYAMPVHSQFVLLAFLIQSSPLVSDFLDKHLGIDAEDGIDSVLFVLREPPWGSADGDPRVWNARGVVQDFLSRLYDIALAPIEVRRTVRVSPWNERKLEFKYLFVKDIVSLRNLVGDRSPARFFRDLESTYVSELIDEVRIRVRLKKNDGEVTFRELSEGEQQLLTVLGLLLFTAEDESLFLLDEPDTHLNPRWSVDYIDYLRSFVEESATGDDTSHVLLTTHNPLSIAELEREQVQILALRQRGERQVFVCHPEMNPKGMGYAAIVTSDMFGIASTLDQPTQLILEKQRALAGKDKLKPDEQLELDQLNDELERLGFRLFHPDDEFSRYLRRRNEALRKRFQTDDPETIARNAVAMSREERETFAQELIDEILFEEEVEEG
ncbi:AAA family ATPase [Aminobacter sp. MET-1]|uniref:AAA family ATPase n=1 Tax=Aminobacter sp. MET-1 TaxID=2951085 RepID=UPI00226A18A2|nr:AAA family ATPase [Aminobacter sp. MET-1]MCX8568788.1 AAA family ATPase [Aminobacter sp. MET-1]